MGSNLNIQHSSLVTGATATEIDVLIRRILDDSDNAVTTHTHIPSKMLNVEI